MVDPELAVADLAMLRDWARSANTLRAIPPRERRTLRENAGISRAVLAELCGVSWERIRSYETGSTPSGPDAHMYHLALEAMRPPGAVSLDGETHKIVSDLFEEHKANFPPSVCEHCKGVHARSCPRVRRIVYNEFRQVVEVEYWSDDAWPKDNVVFADSPEMMDHDEG